MNMQSSVNQRVKFLREQHRITQDEMATKVKCAKQTIFNIEKTGVISSSVAKKIADEFGVTIGWIMEGEGDLSKEISTGDSWKDEAYRLLEEQNENFKRQIEWYQRMLEKAFEPGLPSKLVGNLSGYRAPSYLKVS